MIMRSPLHPVFVHFSIALGLTSFVFDLMGFVWHLAALLAVGCGTLIAATLMTPVTLATGLWSRRHVPVQEGRARAWLRTHMALGPLFFGLLLALCPWRIDLWTRATLSASYLLCMFGVVLLMLVQGYIGGELVYRDGLEVRGRYRALPGQPPQESRPSAAAGTSPAPAARTDLS